MNISLSTLMPNVPASKLQSHFATRSEAQELIAEGLVGEFTTALNLISEETIDRFQFTQWSEQANSQWWALMSEGDAGKEAAGYLEQMVEARRAYATHYLDDYFTLSDRLAEQLQDDFPVSAELDQLLDNSEAGRQPHINADGSELAKADILKQFWQENKAGIEAMQTQYEGLKSIPDNLTDWLDAKQISRSSDVDRVIDKHRYSGLSGSYQPSEALSDSAIARLGRYTDGTVLPATGSLPIYNDSFAPHKAWGFDAKAMADMTQRSVEVGLRIGDARILNNAVASKLMHDEKSALLSTYYSLHKPIEASFYDQLSDLQPQFGLQDLLDNIQDGVPAGQNGAALHPQAEAIAAFADKHKPGLQALVDKQTELDNFPRQRVEWQAIDSNRQRVEQVVYQQYGLEPWETGNNARLLREGIWEGLDYFESQSQDIQQQIISTATEREQKLERTLTRLLPDGSSLGLDLKTVVDNFRFNREPGTLADGSIHPSNAALEHFLTANHDEIVRYIDSAWLLGAQDNLSMVDYHSWMTYDRAVEYAGNLLDLIQQSRETLNLENVMPEDMLLSNSNTE